MPCGSQRRNAGGASWTSSASGRWGRGSRDVPRPDDGRPAVPPLGGQRRGGLHLHLRRRGGAILRRAPRRGPDPRLPVYELRPQLPPTADVLRRLLRGAHGVPRCTQNGTGGGGHGRIRRSDRREALPPPDLGVRRLQRNPRGAPPPALGPPRPGPRGFGGAPQAQAAGGPYRDDRGYRRIRAGPFLILKIGSTA